MGIELAENLMTADFGNKLSDFFELVEQGNLTPFRWIQCGLISC